MILSVDSVESDLLEKLCNEAGFRCKITLSSRTAREWLKISDFAAIFVQRNVSLRDQRDLANLLWTGTPEAPFVMFDLNSGEEFDTGEARLMGAEVAVGKDAVDQIQSLLERLRKEQPKREENFQILVVEDLDSPRYVISLFIEEIGYSRVDGVASAKEALELLEADPAKYSCIVTDIKMPVMDGKQLIEIIRANPKLQQIPIIVLTAYGTSDALVGCLEAGASGFLVKPPKKSDLTRELSRARRIAAGQADPRLADPDEVEAIRRILESRGLV